MTGRTRKRHTLQEMAEFAFEQHLRIVQMNRAMSQAGVEGYPRADDMARAEFFDDICHFLDSIRAMPESVKKDILKHLKSGSDPS